MIRKVYLLEHSKKSLDIVCRISVGFPCFIDLRTNQDGFIEFCVECRQEDIAAIERRLAPVM